MAGMVNATSEPKHFTRPVPAPATLRREREWGVSLLIVRLKEYLSFDARAFRRLVGVIGYLGSMLLTVVGRRYSAFRLLSKLHRGDYLTAAIRGAERVAAKAAAEAGSDGNGKWAKVLVDHVDRLRPTPGTAAFHQNPAGMLGSVAMVLKSPARGEKGVLLLKHPSTYQAFAKHFDLAAIGARYYLVLEPAWSGYCDLDILAYCQYPFPVFVEAFEPRDADFLVRTRSNLVPVPIASNWWVDHRLFKPIAGIAKDIDLVMVAAWGEYKRHFRLFHAMSRLRKQGHRLQALLLGYPNGYSKSEILSQAAWYGVADQLEIHEWVPYDQVNEQINRAKVNLLWSRKEGVNRAMIEGMFAGIPCIVREGFNYGYRYPYVNARTGCFVSEQDLPRKLLWMIENHASFSPREWVSAHMTCHQATNLLDRTIAGTASSKGEPWTSELAVKVNRLHNMEYWNKEDEQRFAADYEFVRNAARRPN